MGIMGINVLRSCEKSQPTMIMKRDKEGEVMGDLTAQYIALISSCDFFTVGVLCPKYGKVHEFFLAKQKMDYKIGDGRLI